MGDKALPPEPSPPGRDPLGLVTLLGREVAGLLAALDIDIIGSETAKTIQRIKQLSGEARLDIRDYGMADSRAEMEENRREARKRLEQLRAHILKASEHGIFSAIDVARLSTELDEIMALLG